MLLVSVSLICELVYHTTCVDILAKDEKYLLLFINCEILMRVTIPFLKGVISNIWQEGTVSPYMADWNTI